MSVMKLQAQKKWTVKKTNRIIWTVQWLCPAPDAGEMQCEDSNRPVRFALFDIHVTVVTGYFYCCIHVFYCVIALGQLGANSLILTPRLHLIPIAIRGYVCKNLNNKTLIRWIAERHEHVFPYDFMCSYFIPKINDQLPLEKWAHRRRNLCSWLSSSDSCPYEKRIRAGVGSFWVPFLRPYRSRHVNYRNHFRSKILRSRPRRWSFPTVVADCSAGTWDMRGFSCLVSSIVSSVLRFCAILLVADLFIDNFVSQSTNWYCAKRDGFRSSANSSQRNTQHICNIGSREAIGKKIFQLSFWNVILRSPCSPSM